LIFLQVLEGLTSAGGLSHGLETNYFKVPRHFVVDAARRARFFVQHLAQNHQTRDKVFFDMPHPEQVEHMTVQAMKAAGIDPAIIHAYEKTGRLVTEDNQHLLSEADLDEWQAAIEEYEMKQRKPRKPPYLLENGHLLRTGRTHQSIVKLPGSGGRVTEAGIFIPAHKGGKSLSYT
jgi:hypothetical protein